MCLVPASLCRSLVPKCMQAVPAALILLHAMLRSSFGGWSAASVPSFSRLGIFVIAIKCIAPVWLSLRGAGPGVFYPGILVLGSHLPYFVIIPEPLHAVKSPCRLMLKSCTCNEGGVFAQGALMLQQRCSISCLQGLATLHQPFVMNSC